MFLVLLERVFLRIGSAETDEQLQNAVSKFLPPVLLKLSSQQEGVRKKVSLFYFTKIFSYNYYNLNICIYLGIPNATNSDEI